MRSAKNLRLSKAWLAPVLALALAAGCGLVPVRAQDINLPRPHPPAGGYRGHPYPPNGGPGRPRGPGWGGYHGHGFGTFAPVFGVPIMMIPAGGPPPPSPPEDESHGPSPRPHYHRAATPPPVAQQARAKPPAPPPIRPAPILVSHALPPPPGETRFRRGEVLVELAPGTSPAAIALILRRHGLVEAEAVDIGLTGASFRLWRIPDARDTVAVLRELGFEPLLALTQPNYLYALLQDAAAPPALPQQYSLDKMHVDASLDISGGEPIRVAVIDTAIDESHPDLAGVVEQRFDAIGGGPPRSLDHGTSIAGAIAAHGRLKGVAPNVKILSARAFDSDGAQALGSTLSVMKAIDWAAREHARVVNMSFAGPQDPALHTLLAAAFAKGLTLVAAAGNAGPKSPPLYPAADEKALAITATDADDRLYSNANVGAYIAVAAPGVDVLLPAPKASYVLETGTSVSAALVSGVVALLLEHRPATQPAEIRKWLVTTAAPLGTPMPKSPFGAGLVDARRAVLAEESAAAAK
jgi:subtilisin family serine protease